MSQTSTDALGESIKGNENLRLRILKDLFDNGPATARIVGERMKVTEHAIGRRTSELLQMGYVVRIGKARNDTGIFATVLNITPKGEDALVFHEVPYEAPRAKLKAEKRLEIIVRGMKLFKECHPEMHEQLMLCIGGENLFGGQT